jgi:hypothetical protein
MLEFVLSKFVLGICAILVIAVIISGFSDTQDELETKTALRTLAALSEVFHKVDDAHAPVGLRFDLMPQMCLGFTKVVIAPGSISMLGDEGRLSIELPDDVILLTKASAGPSADILEAVPPVSIFVEKRFSSSEAWIVIYLENLDATSVTSSVNLSHSSIVL